MQSHIKTLRPTRVAAAVASTLALCSTSAFASMSIVHGVVGGVLFTPPVFADTAAASVPSSTVASVYAGATVCFDTNGNGVCDPGEPTTTTGADGSFVLSSRSLAPLVAQISTSATNNGKAISSRNVFRVNAAQIQAATVNPMVPAIVNITPLSTEVTLAIENQGLSYIQAVDNLAQRLGVASSDVLLPPTQVTDSTEAPAIIQESVVAQNRLQLAAKFVDRGDTVGELRGNFDCANAAAAALITAADSTADGCAAGDSATVSIAGAEQWAFNLEGMPQFDNVFVIVLENESQSSVQGSSHAPFINTLLNSGGVYENYYSTGDPSEPNYLALGGADDWGQTGDETLPYPAVQGVRANLFNAIDAQGLTWRVYEGSLWPSAAGSQANLGAALWNSSTGGLWFDNPSESTISSTAPSYPFNYTDTATGVTTTLASNAEAYSYGSGLRAVKHNMAVWYADAAAQPDFASNDRSFSPAPSTTDVNNNPIVYPYGSTNLPFESGTTTAPSSLNLSICVSYTCAGQWDGLLQTYASNNGITSWWTGNSQPWNVDQFKLDLQTGDVGNLNFIVPDQDDDMHNIGVQPRADATVYNIVAKIQSSPLWNNPAKRVAIVVTFDEGESATTACCGWNAERTGDGAAQLLTVAANGTVTSSAPALVPYTEAYAGASGTQPVTFTPPADSRGNHGHGVTTFGILTNQQALGNAPTGLYDSDYYSHFSFVRTVQDVLGLSDPGLPGTYMNRSKYTEAFIQENATVLPEFANSANPHFDGVRAMNHVYQFPAGVTRLPAAGVIATPPVTTGPDATQTNLWATTPAN